MLPKGKNAVIYGGGGAIGGAIARAFAREGAQVFLAGRTLSKLDAVAEDIRAAGGTAHTAVVDALDGAAVDADAETVGRIDISFNAITHHDVGNVAAFVASDHARTMTAVTVNVSAGALID